MRFKNHLKTFIAICLCLALLGAFYNAFFNSHLHIDTNGRIIVHSHPFNRTPTQNSPLPQHTHSKIEFLLYTLFSMAEFILFIFLLRFNFKEPSGYLKFQITKNIKSNPLLSTLIRAPPLSV